MILFCPRIIITATSGHFCAHAKLWQEHLMRMVRWHCPPNTGSEIRTLEVWGRARCLSVTEAAHDNKFYEWMGEETYVSFKLPVPVNEPRPLA